MAEKRAETKAIMEAEKAESMAIKVKKAERTAVKADKAERPAMKSETEEKAEPPAIIAFANNKGGSGKTTTCANVGYSLSALGKKVLLIDGDMQMNLSLSFFSEEEVLGFAAGDRNLYLAMKKEEDLWDYVVHTPYDNLDLIPSSTLMSGIEYDLFTKWQRELILSRSLERLKGEGGYDYILIDAPPTLGGWVMNILCASDYVMLPVEASPWGLFGVANMFEFLEHVKKLAPGLNLLGVVITKMDVRKNYGRQTLEALHEFKEVNVFRTVIRVDSEIEWAQDNSKPVMAYRKSARSAGEYLELAKEVESYVGGSKQH